MARLYTPTDSKPVTPQDGSKFTLEEVYDMLDCTTIEMIGLQDGIIMLIDEDAIMRQSPLNNAATHIAQRSLLGNVLVCEWRQFS